MKTAQDFHENYNRYDAEIENQIANLNRMRDGFAAKIAETVDKTMNPYGKKVAFISDKQSWILAVAAVENNITL